LNISENFKKTLALANKAQILDPDDLGPEIFKIARYGHYAIIFGAFLLVLFGGFSRTANIIIAGLATPAFSTSIIWPMAEWFIGKSWPFPEKNHILAGFVISHCIGIAVTVTLIMTVI
jgi:hypothetical protein